MSFLYIKATFGILKIVFYAVSILSTNFRNGNMFMNGQARVFRIILRFIEWLNCSSSNFFPKLSVVMASSKESLTRTKTSSVPTFLFFFFLDIYLFIYFFAFKGLYWPSKKKLYFFVVKFAVSSTTWRVCVWRCIDFLVMWV